MHQVERDSRERKKGKIMDKAGEKDVIGRPPIYNEPMKLLNFYCNFEQYEWLNKRSKELGIYRAELMRRLIDQEIQKNV